MKKIIYSLFLVCVILAFITSCSDFKTKNKNTIQSLQLLPEQKKIVDLTSDIYTETQLFSYNSEEKFKKIDFWVEIYKNGKLIKNNEKGIKLQPVDSQRINGELAIKINKKNGQWTFINIDSAGGKSSEVCKLGYILGKGPSVLGPITKPVTISQTKEIIIYSILCSKDGVMVNGIDNEQKFVNNQALLKDYGYAYLIKCKFTK
jgi:hypothetical protein